MSDAIDIYLDELTLRGPVDEVLEEMREHVNECVGTTFTTDDYIRYLELNAKAWRVVKDLARRCRKAESA